MSSTKVTIFLPRRLPARPKRPTGDDPVDFGQAHCSGNVVPFRLKRKALPEKFVVPPKEGLRRDVPANAQAGHRHPQRNDDLRPPRACHRRPDPLALVFQRVPKKVYVVRARANRDVVLDVRGQADALELEGELQEGAGGILSQEVMLILDGLYALMA